jgi:hypothetical protein
LNAFDAIGLIIAAFQATLGALVLASLPSSRRAGNAGLAALFAAVSFAAAVWIGRAVWLA